MAMTSLKPIKIDRLNPPQDSLIAQLDRVDLGLKDGDVVVVASKVVAIDEGRSVPFDGTDKDVLVAEESDAYIPRDYNKYGFALSIVHHALIASAGIDESNSGDYYTLLPAHPFESAKRLWIHLKEKYGLERLGIIITDSHCVPLRSGTVGISIGFWGLAPYHDYRDTPDLFQRDFKFSRANYIDSISAAANGVMGEGDECTPICVVRDWPRLHFSDQDPRETDFLIEPKADVFWPLLEVFKRLGGDDRE